MTGEIVSPIRTGERGFTLMEVVIVVVLASLVTLALVGFYLQSQAMWMEASTQALAQRDATALLELMRDKTSEAARAAVVPSSPDSTNHKLLLYAAGQTDPSDSFFWSFADSLVHHGTGPADQDQGPVVGTIVERFHLSLHPTLPLVSLDTLRVRATSGPRVQMSATFALYNGLPQ